MVKFGAHAYLWVNRWADEHVGLLDHARSLGLDWLELPWGDDMEFSAGLTRRSADAAGLTLTVSPGGVWPMECDISRPDPEEQAMGLAWHRRAIDAAGELGAIAYTGAIYGHPGRMERHVPTDEEYRRMAGHLHTLAGHAAGRGVSLVLEPMSRFRTHLVNTPEQVMLLAAMADHPNLRVLLDTYHLVTEVRDFAAAVRTAGPRLWGIHACENDRGVPGGGLIPWTGIAAALAEIRFEGYIGLECYNSGPGGQAEQRGILHNPCPDGDDFARRGLAFLRGALTRNPPGPAGVLDVPADDRTC